MSKKQDVLVELYRLCQKKNNYIFDSSDNGRVAVFEAKNGKHDNFVIYQLYHPFFYYYNAKKNREIGNKIKDIFCIYVSREMIKNEDIISLWKYTFSKPNDITSIKYLDSASYKLVKDKEC